MLYLYFFFFFFFLHLWHLTKGNKVGFAYTLLDTDPASRHTLNPITAELQTATPTASFMIQPLLEAGTDQLQSAAPLPKGVKLCPTGKC